MNTQPAPTQASQQELAKHIMETNAPWEWRHPIINGHKWSKPDGTMTALQWSNAGAEIRLADKPAEWKPKYKVGDPVLIKSTREVGEVMSVPSKPDGCYDVKDTINLELPLGENEIEPAPWSLPALPAGMAWHRSDFTQDMLPPVSDGLPWRPLLLDERIVDGDEMESGPKRWTKCDVVGVYCLARAIYVHHRTRRPLLLPTPDSGEKWADVMRAVADGKRIEFIGGEAAQWTLWPSQLDVQWKNPHYSFRVYRPDSDLPTPPTGEEAALQEFTESLDPESRKTFNMYRDATQPLTQEPTSFEKAAEALIESGVMDVAMKAEPQPEKWADVRAAWKAGKRVQVAIIESAIHNWETFAGDCPNFDNENWMWQIHPDDKPDAQPGAEWPDVIGAGIGLGPEPATVKEAIEFIGPHVDFTKWWGLKDWTYGDDATPYAIAGLAWEAAHNLYNLKVTQPAEAPPLAGSAGEAAYNASSQIAPWKELNREQRASMENAAQAAIAHSATSQGEKPEKRTDQQVREYILGLKVGERVIETTPSALFGRCGTVYLGTTGDVCVMWDKERTEQGHMGTSCTQGARRVSEVMAEQNPQPPAEQETLRERVKELESAMVEIYGCRTMATYRQAMDKLTEITDRVCGKDGERLSITELSSTSPTVAGSGASVEELRSDYEEACGYTPDPTGIEAVRAAMLKATPGYKDYVNLKVHDRDEWKARADKAEAALDALRRKVDAAQKVLAEQPTSL